MHLRDAGSLVLSTLSGIPLGLLLLKTAPETAVKTILAAIIIAFAVYSMAGRRTHELRDDRVAWFFGFHAGVLSGAYGMNGPPLAIYGALRRWPLNAHFRLRRSHSVSENTPVSCRVPDKQCAVTSRKNQLGY